MNPIQQAELVKCNVPSCPSASGVHGEGACDKHLLEGVGDDLNDLVPVVDQPRGDEDLNDVGPSPITIWVGFAMIVVAAASDLLERGKDEVGGVCSAVHLGEVRPFRLEACSSRRNASAC